MANSIKNDRGVFVCAVGAPGSIERVKLEYPDLIDRLNLLYYQSFDAYGRAVDKAIQLIRDAGIKSELETRSLLSASAYSLEPDGSVTKLLIVI